jgi:hypothetical protein
MYGIPGAAHLGQASFNDGSFSGATACSQKGFALLTNKSGALFLAKLPGGQPAEVSNLPLQKARVLFSPSCSSALEYAANGSGSALILGLPAAPKVTLNVIPSSLPLAGAVVGDSGSVLFATGQADGSVAVQYLAASGGAATPVTTLSKFGGMNYLPNAETALIADAGQNTVVKAAQLGGSLSLTNVASIGDGVSQPSAVAASADGRMAVVANSSSLLRVDLSGQSAPVKVGCSCSPVELVPLSGNAVFRLNEPGAATVWAFDGDSAHPRVVFLPNVQGTSSAGKSQ